MNNFHSHKQPFKGVNHTSGPINRLGQYSKFISPNHIAFIGDSIFDLVLVGDIHGVLNQLGFAIHHIP